LGPLGTAAINTPIVPAPGDDGEIGEMMICRVNRSTRRKPAPVPPCPQQNHMLPGCEPGPPQWEASDGNTLNIEEFYLPRYNAVYSTESQPALQRECCLYIQDRRLSRASGQRETSGQSEISCWCLARLFLGS
jgi:hypothetical protein